MSKKELKRGVTYYGKANPRITRKILSMTYNEWLNCYDIDYRSSKFEGVQCCIDKNFAAWAGGRVKGL